MTLFWKDEIHGPRFIETEHGRRFGRRGPSGRISVDRGRRREEEGAKGEARRRSTGAPQEGEPTSRDIETDSRRGWVADRRGERTTRYPNRPQPDEGPVARTQSEQVPDLHGAGATEPATRRRGLWRAKFGATPIGRQRDALSTEVSTRSDAPLRDRPRRLRVSCRRVGRPVSSRRPRVWVNTSSTRAANRRRT